MYLQGTRTVLCKTRWWRQPAFLLDREPPEFQMENPTFVKCTFSFITYIHSIISSNISRGPGKKAVPSLCAAHFSDICQSQTCTFVSSQTNYLQNFVSCTPSAVSPSYLALHFHLLFSWCSLASQVGGCHHAKRELRNRQHLRLHYTCCGKLFGNGRQVIGKGLQKCR